MPQNGIWSFLPFIVMLVLFYLILFVPEKKRRKKYTEMLNSLKVNDEIITKGGVIGKIITIKDDYIVLESGPDRARIKFSKNGISNVIKSKEEVAVDNVEEKNVEENKK